MTRANRWPTPSPSLPRTGASAGSHLAGGWRQRRCRARLVGVRRGAGGRRPRRRPALRPPPRPLPPPPHSLPQLAPPPPPPGQPTFPSPLAPLLSPCLRPGRPGTRHPVPGRGRGGRPLPTTGAPPGPPLPRPSLGCAPREGRPTWRIPAYGLLRRQDLALPHDQAVEGKTVPLGHHPLAPHEELLRV